MIEVFLDINKPKMAYSCDLAYMDYHGLSQTIIDCHGHGLDLDILFTDRRTDIGTF